MVVTRISPAFLSKDSLLADKNLGPREITPKNVQYWSAHTKELLQPAILKSNILVEQNLIRYAGNGCFEVLPIPGYNKTTYTIEPSPVYEKTFECSCQGWQSKYKKNQIVVEGANCSHVLALYFCFRLKRFNKNEGGD